MYPILNPEMLGHCVIINNLATEYSGSKKDVDALQKVYEKIKFRVTVKQDCNDRVIIKASFCSCDHILSALVNFRTCGRLNCSS